MPCRIGITTDPQERRAYWQNQHPTLRNWQILGVYPTKSQAQQVETQTARNRGCQASPGGAGPEAAQWSVYYFDY